MSDMAKKNLILWLVIAVVLMSVFMLLASIFISWFPMLLLIGVWIFFMRQMQGGGGKGAMSFGKSKRAHVDGRSDQNDLC